MYADRQPFQQYRALQINTATPLQRLLMVYDAAIIGCGQRDLKKTIDALELLSGTLDMEQGGEVAVGFFRLYQYCGEQARAGNFDESAKILRGLVEAWIEVLVRQTNAKVAEAPSASSFAVAA